MTLEVNFLHNRERITAAYLEEATRFQKIKGTTEVMLQITRTGFFDTLLEEIKALGGLEVPALIVWGDQEKSIPLPIGEALHELLPGSRFEVLKDAGHCSHIDQPEQFNQLALDFLAIS
jgi:pimeloyl-ACP methyl ester carboxylesterase